MNPLLKALITHITGPQKNQAHKLLLAISMFFLAALACNFGGSPPPQGESIGSIQKEISDVLHNAVLVETKNTLEENDTLSVQNGGVGLLDFGDDLRLRMFNESQVGEIKGTLVVSDPSSPIDVQMTLSAGGFSGQLFKSGNKATFKTPNGAKILVKGTEFFVVYDPMSQITTVGNFSGSVGVLAGNESAVLVDGHYLEVRPNSPPGEQKEIPFTFLEFEDRARQLDSPIEALVVLLADALAKTTPPTPTVTLTPSPTPPTITHTPTPTPTITHTLTPTSTFTLTPTDTNTPDITTVVPDIVGLSLDTAITVITTAGLQVGQIIERQLAGQEPDTILSQSPRAGDVVDKDSVVDIVVIKQVVQIEVPDVMGMAQDEAVEEIMKAGFLVQKTEQQGYHQELGSIIEQDPLGGEFALPGATINLTVSASQEGYALWFDGMDDFVSIFESGWYYAYNWFDNSTWPTSTEEPIATQIPPVEVPIIEVLSVYKDEIVTVQAVNLPPGEEFIVRMGPMGTRGIGGIVMGSVDTSSDGAQQYTFNIPSALQGEDQISIRFESMPKGHFDFDNSFTVEAWVKPTSLTGEGGLRGIVLGALSEPPEPEGEYAIFMNESDDSDWGLAVCMSCPPHSVECVRRCGTATSGPEGLQVDQWQHVAGIYNGDEIVTYWNGREISRQDHTGNVADIEFLIIGTVLATFNGYIDEVLVWNTARTPSQIMDDMNQKVDVQEAGLVGYWRFNEGSGQIVFDSSPQRNHGRLGANSMEDDNDPLWSTSSPIE